MATEKLLLLSGAIGAGKTSVADVLKARYQFKKISSSGYLLSLILPDELREGDQRRRQLQELGDRLDEETDFRWIVDPVARDAIEQSPEVRNWLIDAVRKRKQVEHFRSHFGPIVRHIHLTAPEKVLRARYTDRRGEYDKAIAHPNEVNARSLEAIADRVIDTSDSDSDSIALQIMAEWGATNV
jgi:adenylate kinase family enzyme